MTRILIIQPKNFGLFDPQSVKVARRVEHRRRVCAPVQSRMLSTKFAWAALAVLATSSVSATYFTAPAASTVWTHAPGQEITWKYQAGGAPQGDILLVGMSAAGTPM